MADRTLELALKIKALVDGAKSVEALSDDLAALAQEAKRAEAPAGALGEQLAELSQDAQRAETPVAALEDHLKAVGQSAKAAAAPLDGAQQGVDDLGRAARATPAPLQRMEGDLRQLARAAQEAETPLIEASDGIEHAGQSAKTSGSAIGKLGGAFQALAGAVVVQQFVEANKNAEALRNALTALTGSSQKSAEEVQWLTETANRLGVELGAVSKAYIGLAAASKGTQLEGKATRDIFEAVVGAMATLGKSGDEAQNALTAVAQMMGKGVVQAEELRGQLEEALPGATQALARALGMTVADLDKLATTGGIVSRDVLPALAAELKKTYNVGGDGATTLTASLARVQNAITLVFTSIGDAGALKIISEAAGEAGLVLTGFAGAIQVAGAAINALYDGFAKADFSKFNEAVDAAIIKSAAQIENAKQYSGIMKLAFGEADAAATGHAEALEGVTTAGQKTADQSTQTAGTLTKLQFAHQKASEAAELQKTRLDNLASATTAFGQISQAAAEQTGDYVRQLQLAVTVAAQDEQLKWQQAAAASRVAADVQSYYEALKQQTGVMPDVLEAAQKDVLAKQAEADAALAAATAAGQQAAAVKAASEVILAQIEQQGLSAEEAKRKAAELRAEYEAMRASGAPLAELVVKMNEVVLAEDAARTAAKGYREERAMTAATVAQYKQQLDEAKASGEGVTDAQLKYNAALALYETQLGTALTQLERKNQIQDQGRAADIAAVKAAADLAQARGNEAEATRLQVQAGELAIRQAQDNVAARRAELAVLKEQRDAAAQKALSDQVLTQAEQAHLQALNDGIAAKQTDIKATEASVEAARAQVAAIRQSAAEQAAAAEAARAKAEADREAAKATKAAAEANAQRKAAGEAVTNIMNKEIAAIRALGGDTEALTERFHELQRQFSNRVILDMGDWMGLLAGATRQVKQEFESQKGAAEELIAQYEGIADGTQAATATQLRMGEVVGDTGREFGLLNEQDLSRLQSAIEAANQKLKEMQQETQDARTELQELNAELLEAQGQDQKAELLRQELDYQERLAAIELRRREAELLGNRDLVALLDRQADVLRQINDAKVKSIQADADAEQAGDKVARSWVNAEAAVRATKSTLGEVHSLSTKIAQTDLSGFEKGMTGVADAATKLSRIL